MMEIDDFVNVIHPKEKLLQGVGRDHCGVLAL